MEQGDTVSPKFDSMMGKVVITAQSREAAVARVRRALDELVIEGVPTPASLFKQIFNDDEFTAEHGHLFDVSTKWLERKYLNHQPRDRALGAGVAQRRRPGRRREGPDERSFVIEVDDRRVKLTVPTDIVNNLMGAGRSRGAKRPSQPLRGQGLHAIAEKKERNDGKSGVIASPMQAVVTRINVAEGQSVTKGDLLVVLESMKMENYVYAPVNGTVAKIFVAPATGVEAGETLVAMDVDGAKAARASPARWMTAASPQAPRRAARRASDDRYHELAGREGHETTWASLGGRRRTGAGRQPIRAAVVRAAELARDAETRAPASTPRARKPRANASAAGRHRLVRGDRPLPGRRHCGGNAGSAVITGFGEVYGRKMPSTRRTSPSGGHAGSCRRREDLPT